MAEQLPEVAVPDVGADVSCFAEVLEHERYFEVDKVVQDDLNRSAYYSSNAQRSAGQAKFTNYGEFLASLEMTAEIGPFLPVYLERITQLINKTNQFNLTTRRYTSAEVVAIAQRPGLYHALRAAGRQVWRQRPGVGPDRASIGRDGGTRSLADELSRVEARDGTRHVRCAGRTVPGAWHPQDRRVSIFRPRRTAWSPGTMPALASVAVGGTSEGRELWRYDVPATYSARTRHIRRTAEVPS